jgi:hypothetical protein
VIPRRPFKADPPLVIDADAALALAVAFQVFEAYSYDLEESTPSGSNLILDDTYTITVQNCPNLKELCDRPRVREEYRDPGRLFGALANFQACEPPLSSTDGFAKPASKVCAIWSNGFCHCCDRLTFA